LNAAANHLELELWCTALAGERGFRRLSIVDNGNSGLSSLRPWSDVKYDASLQCWCETGDYLVASGLAPAPAVIKMDVEGFELEVFSGMSSILASRTLRHIVFEARGDLLDKKPSYGLAELLRGHGFSVSRVKESGFEWIASRDE
jgi:FkbM family methyltransferase